MNIQGYFINNLEDHYNIVGSKIDSLINENGNKTKQLYIRSHYGGHVVLVSFSQPQSKQLVMNIGYRTN